MAKKPVKYCVVDAFTDEAFKGNPAAVCLLEEERDDEWLQAVAREFNLSETCYLTRFADSPESTNYSANAPPIPRFHLRWFTPVAEVKLCGHATLAASHFLFTYGLVNADVIEFSTLSGILTAKRIPDIKISDSSNFQNGDASETWLIELDFPVVPIMEYDYVADVSAISKSLNGASVMEIKKTTTENDLLVSVFHLLFLYGMFGNVNSTVLDNIKKEEKVKIKCIVVLPSGNAVAEVEPQFDEIKNCPGGGIIITGPAPAGSGFDFFSRFFCPKLGIDEDPVCGSAHCALVPYWSKRLGKCDFVAYQASPRSGVLNLHLDEENQRVLLRGKATLMMEGSVLV